MNVKITGPVDDHVFLMGRPPINEFLGFVVTSTVTGQAVNHGALVNEWREANHHVEQLMANEAGLADSPGIEALPSDVAAVAQEASSKEEFQRAYQSFPFEFGMVELDRLVVYQKSINLGYVAKLRELLGDAPTSEKVARVAYGLDRSDPGVAVAQAGNMFTFLSSSNDFRFLMPRIFQPDEVKNDFTTGPLSHVLGLAVGYSANCLTVVSLGKRLVLYNGSHRAYALRDMGKSHAPCVILRLSSRDELELLGAADVTQHPERYLDSPRPPLLKDYFDQKLRKVVQVARKNRVVRLQFVFDQTELPAA